MEQEPSTVPSNFGSNFELQAGETYSWWDWARNLGVAFLEGGFHGGQIVVNEYTFGLTDYLGWTRGSELVEMYGKIGTASKWSSRISRDALIAAGGLKGYEKLTGIRFELHAPHIKGPHGYPHIQAIKGPGWGKTIGRLPKSHPWWWPKGK